jgi:Family of unknown function (DUF6173)
MRAVTQSMIPIPVHQPKLLDLPNPAKNAIDAIFQEIADFELGLDDEHELGMSVVGGPTGLCIHVREVYRFGNDKLIFNGIDTNHSPVRLVQHISQLNFLMLAVKIAGDEPVRIGFHVP